MTPRLFIHIALATALLFVGPAALADPGNGHGRCGRSDEHPGNGKGPKCSSEEDGSSSSEASPSPSPSEDPSGEGSENENPNEGPPSHSNGNPPEKDNRPNKEDPPRAQPSPTPSGSPGDPGSVLVDAFVDRSMAQIGDTLTYTIIVRNPGTEAISPTVTSAVPEEVRFLSANAQPGPTYSAGTLTWTATDLAPGAVRSMTWTGRVVAAGDLEAVNVVTTTGSTTPAIEAHTYLADVQGVVLHRSPQEPDWGTHEEREVVFSTEERPATVAPGEAAANSSGALPYTGAPVIPMLFGAALLVAGGCMLATNKARRVSAVALLVVMVAAACTSDAPPRDETAQTDESDQGDEVLGTRVGRGNDGDESQGGNGGASDASDENQGSPTRGSGEDAGEDDGPTTPDGDQGDATEGAPPVAAPAEPEEVTTREVVVVEVPNEPPAPRSLESSSADNEISLGWNAASGSITGASSRAIFRADSPIQFLTSLHDGAGRISAEVTMTNVTDEERLLVGGRFVLTVTGDEGSFELASPTLEQVLDPDDEVSAGYEFALPTGNYEIVAAYVSS